MISKLYLQAIKAKGNFLLGTIAGFFIIFGGLVSAPNAQAEVLFEDHFYNESSLNNYTIKHGIAWIENQRLYTQGNSWPRGSLALVNGNPQWTNFKMSVKVQPIAGWHDTEVTFRTTDYDFHPSGFGRMGKGYILNLVKDGGGGPAEMHGEQAQFDYAVLVRIDCPAGCNGEVLSEARFAPLIAPVDVNIVANEGRIQVFLNGTQYIDTTDPNPLPAGGIGLGALWETLATFDDLVVQDIGKSFDVCKNGGWRALTRDDTSHFKNQGDCIQYYNTGK